MGKLIAVESNYRDYACKCITKYKYITTNLTNDHIPTPVINFEPTSDNFSTANIIFPNTNISVSKNSIILDGEYNMSKLEELKNTLDKYDYVIVTGYYTRCMAQSIGWYHTIEGVKDWRKSAQTIKIVDDIISNTSDYIRDYHLEHGFIKPDTTFYVHRYTGEEKNLDIADAYEYAKRLSSYNDWKYTLNLNMIM